MLSAIGLALDFVGAIALVLGLFGHTRPLVTGYSLRSPDDVAHDTAFGIVGAALLSSGFVLQSLMYFGVRVECSHRTVIIVAALALIAAVLFAWAAFGVAYIVVMEREKRYVVEHWGDPYPVTRQRRGLQFWRYVPENREQSNE
jgi:hypothetical protein